jgi:pyruvate/2-oxoglutarate dehydrogenase complex dihydrolipoamide acyltransferase (E2) component
LPGFLLGAFIAVASRSARIGLKSGKLAVSSVGMFSKEACWFLPHGAPTVLLTVGSIVRRPVETEGGIEVREHLCLTLSFDHDVVDGSPAARFVGDLSAEISGGVPISLLLEGAAGSRP